MTEESIKNLLFYEIHTALENQTFLLDIDVGTVIENALNTALNTALDKIINEAINSIDINEIISTHKLGILYSAVSAGLDPHETENELDRILKTSILGEDLRKTLKDTIINEIFTPNE